jgi:ABC-type amino acid transport substrate-binding protein
MSRSTSLVLIAAIGASWLLGASGVAHAEAAAPRVLKVCADPANLPFSSADPQRPGFEVELAAEVAEQLGAQVAYHWWPSYLGKRALRHLVEGRCDLFMGVPIDARFAEANPALVVSAPYYTMAHLLVFRPPHAIAALGDLGRRRVGVERVSIADLFLFERGFKRAIYRSQEAAFQAVVAGEVEAARLWSPLAGWLVKDHPELRWLWVAEPELTFPIGAAMRRADAGLKAAVDGTLHCLQEQGRVRHLLAKYGVPLPAASPETRHGAEEGGKLYHTACSRCHGADGRGVGQVPSLVDYQGGVEGFVKVVLAGRSGTQMAPSKGILTEEEVHHIYRYLRSLAAR